MRRAASRPRLVRTRRPSGPTTWQTLRVRPGKRPLHALSNALYSASHALQCTAPRLRERMRASAGALTEALARGFAGGMVLIVDPLDEAIAAADRDEREVFAAALAHAVAHASVPFVLLTATRSEHLGDLQRLPALHDRTLGRDPPVCFGLAPMTLDQYRRAICGPARRAGINVAGRFLERFIADIEALTEGPSAPPPGTILALVADTRHALDASLRREGLWLRFGEGVVLRAEKLDVQLSVRACRRRSHRSTGRTCCITWPCT